MKRGALLWKDGTSIIPEDGAKLIRPLGIDLYGLRRTKRPLVLACSDRTEGRPHVAGALGQALCELFLASGWIRRRPGTRALSITDSGATWLRERLDLELR